MTKVSLFVPDLEGGGAERMMVHLANEFSLKSLAVDLVLAESKGHNLFKVEKSVHIVDLNTPFSNPLIIFKLASYLRNVRPTALLTAMTYPNIAGLLAGKIARVSTRIVISERTTLTVQSGNIKSLRECLKPAVAKRLYRFADHIVAISDGVAENLHSNIGIRRDKITTIYNPVVTPELLQPHSKPDHPWFANTQSPIILAAGRFVAAKDFSTLIKAFAEVKKQRDARLIILGEGPQRKILTDLIAQLNLMDSISLPGFVQNPACYMQHASLFVLSSRWEGFGNVLVEALACGCPVVSTNCPSGPEEILDSGKYGKLVLVGDPHALANAILSTLDKPPAAEILHHRAMQFTAEKSAENYLKILLPDSQSCRMDEM